MSIQAKAARALLRATNIRGAFDQPLDKILEGAAKANERFGFRLPSDRKRTYRCVEVDGCPVLVAQVSETPSQRAILFFTGGGFTRRPAPLQLDMAFKLGDKAGSDVWIPYYPLCLGVSVRAPYDMCLDTYVEMLGLYAAEDMSFVGLSAGANLALGLLLYNNALGRPLPMPRQSIPLSCGAMPATDAERARVAELDPLDLMIPAASLPLLEEVMRADDPKVLDFMLSCQLCDFSGLPPVHLFVGSNEILLATTESVAAACAASGVDYTLTIGPGMWHCYPALPICPEARKGFEQVVSWLG